MTGYNVENNKTTSIGKDSTRYVVNTNHVLHCCLNLVNVDEIRDMTRTINRLTVPVRKNRGK